MKQEQKTITVAAALIKSQTKILLAQRAYGHLKGKWEFPGGKIDPGETPFQTIQREIKEELQIDIQPQKEVKKFEHQYDFAKVHLTLIECEIKNDSQKIISDGSHTKIDWISLEEKNLDLAPLDQKIFTYLQKTS